MIARHRAFIARSVGIVSIALGFVAGMHGLEHPDSIWLPTALGLIVTGLLLGRCLPVAILKGLRPGLAHFRRRVGRAEHAPGGADDAAHQGQEYQRRRQYRPLVPP